jgi:hypothetical protein
MGFWRNEVIQRALGRETERQMDEQRAWIAREPGNARPYFHLAQFYRTLALLLEAVRLDGAFGEALVSLAEVYAIRGDYDAAWGHARAAEASGDRRAVEMLQRYGAR